jgi:general secretion pathway protein J
MNSSSENNIRGFTLIEVLLSMALLTIILGAVYSSFFTVNRALDRFNNVSLRYHEARTALDIMRREIESAYLSEKSKKEDSETYKTAFVIEDRDIFGKGTSLLHFSSFSFKSNNLNIITYSVKEKDGRLNLVKKESPVIPVSRGYELEILDDIEGFTVETFFNNKWVRTWDTAMTGELPGIVRVSIEFDDNGKRVKLTEYARPRIGKPLL